MKSLTKTNSRENILEAARGVAQARGYGGLNFRDLADLVGIKSASMYHHFPSKADLGAAVARRYWEGSAADLEAMWGEQGDPLDGLRQYPEIFRRSLENDNRLCLGSYMAAEYNELPEAVKIEVQAYADVHVAWLSKILVAAGIVNAEQSLARARAIYAAVAGAQLLARSRADLALFDELIQNYRAAGLLPA